MEEKIKKYPSTKDFRIKDTIGVPHRYCITPKHVAHASDNFCGMLGKEAIISAEKNGVVCDICKKQGNILSYEEHKTALLVECKVYNDEELKKYLLSIKAMAEKDGFAGFAFLKAF